MQFQMLSVLTALTFATLWDCTSCLQSTQTCKLDASIFAIYKHCKTLYIMLEIHHSGREPSKYDRVLQCLFQVLLGQGLVLTADITTGLKLSRTEALRGLRNSPNIDRPEQDSTEELSEHRQVRAAQH